MNSVSGKVNVDDGLSGFAENSAQHENHGYAAFQKAGPIGARQSFDQAVGHRLGPRAPPVSSMRSRAADSR
jgi:hypothetical protein